MSLVDHSPALVAVLVVSTVALIVAYDVLHLVRNRRTVPLLGELPNGGYAWTSTLAQEALRNSANILTMLAIMVLPWMLAIPSDTPVSALVIFDLLLALLLVTMLLPKRYAITATHLYADGQRTAWESLHPLDSEKGWWRRIVLQRRGWWLFAPLPLGGSEEELHRVHRLIMRFQTADTITEAGIDREEE